MKFKLAPLHGGRPCDSQIVNAGMSRPSKGQKGLDLGELVKLRWGGLQNMLRLRTEYKFNDKLTGEIGADFHAQQKFMLPFLCLDYRVRQFAAVISWSRYVWQLNCCTCCSAQHCSRS